MLTRLALYAVFVLFAAPFEMLLDWSAGILTSDRATMMRPLAEAAVYLYAFTLAIETLFRLEVKRDVYEKRPWARYLQYAAWLVVFAFAVDYLNVLRPLLNDGGSALEAAPRQFGIATLALIASMLSYYACEISIRRRRVAAR